MRGTYIYATQQTTSGNYWAKRQPNGTQIKATQRTLDAGWANEAACGVDNTLSGDIDCDSGAFYEDDK